MANKQDKDLLLHFQDIIGSKSKIIADLEERMESKNKCPIDAAHGDNKHTDSTHYDYHRDKHDNSHTDKNHGKKLIDKNKNKPT